MFGQVMRTLTVDAASLFCRTVKITARQATRRPEGHQCCSSAHRKTTVCVQYVEWINGQYVQQQQPPTFIGLIPNRDFWEIRFTCRRPVGLHAAATHCWRRLCRLLCHILWAVLTHQTVWGWASRAMVCVVAGSYFYISDPWNLALRQIRHHQICRLY